ncbi:MAG: hypothetical protein NZ924_06880, partial [Candidatus Bipolaricaulota bacterium]|nr:hypothetical protein [Candidatus Bipolaricaulota bacterium]MDW8152602.1 hypothetical protein [Candidatus Bipolaricaulota bacterium]
LLTSQSLSGWEGFFHRKVKVVIRREKIPSQSLSGWEGFFHNINDIPVVFFNYPQSQSLSGWEGFFHQNSTFLWEFPW